MKMTLLERWELVEKLLDEKARLGAQSGLGTHPTIYELFTNEAWRDQRFVDAGLTYNERRYIEYEGAAAEAAVCEFLGLGVTLHGRPNAAALEFMMAYRRPVLISELQEKLRSRIERLKKSRGYPDE